MRASEGSVKTNGRRSPQEERQKKHAREVSEQARDIEKIHTWHDGTAVCTVAESMADFARD